MKKEMFSLDAFGHPVTAFRVTACPKAGKALSPISTRKTIPEKRTLPLLDVALIV